MLSESATKFVKAADTSPSSFVCDLRQWLDVAEAYEQGNFKYYATLPTDALVKVRDAMIESKKFGFHELSEKAKELGRLAHNVFCGRGFVCVAAPGFEAPGVIVVHAEQTDIAARFSKIGTQVKCPLFL